MGVSPTARFSDRAADYDAYRPSYPAEAIDVALEDLGDPASLTIADIGAGTGISSRLLAQRGARVLAIEPNEAMRSLGAARGGGIEWIDATGEHTGLDDDSADMILCAQSFHWLDEDDALDEFARILRPRGRICLLWNVQDPTDEFTASYRGLLHEHSIDAPRSPSYAKAPPRPLDGRPGWTDLRYETFTGGQDLDLRGLIGRAVSSSYCPNDGPGRDRVVAGLEALFARFSSSGRVRLVYITELQRACCAKGE